jgi:hypothetical protein
VKQLEIILASKDSSVSGQSGPKKVVELSQLKRTQFFDLKQILKLNSEQIPAQKALMIPEDGFPQFSLEKAPTGDKSGKGVDANDRPLIPMNQFINTDQSNAERMATLQETYFNKLNQLT